MIIPHPQTNYVTIQKIGAMVASKSVDFLMGDEFTVTQYATDGYFYNLEELLPELPMDIQKATAAAMPRIQYR